MFKFLYHWLWHIPTGGLCFLTFFTMGLLYLIAVVPALYVFIRDEKKRVRVARRIVSGSFRAFLWLLKLEHVSLEVRNAHRLKRQGLLICPSHPTLIDVVILISMIENANCVVKASLRDSLVMRGPIRACGYMGNDDGVEIVSEVVQSLSNGDNVVLFPEGTRTSPGQEPHLQRGAAAIAIAGKVNITPVKITCTPPALMKGVPWYGLPACKMRFVVEIKDDIDISEFLLTERETSHPLQVRKLTRLLKETLFPSGLEKF